ncbi:hypothetical protein QZH41_015855, partial [Actinostola sp. cb2023]
FPTWHDTCNVFVVDEQLQVDVTNQRLLEGGQKLICVRDCKDSNYSEARFLKQPFTAVRLTRLFSCMKQLMTNNYAAACMALGGAVMSLGYSQITVKMGCCPVVLLTGDTETGKSTVLRCCMGLFGDRNIKDYTGKKALQSSTYNDMPFAWDDPTSPSDVAFIVQALFNGAGRDTIFQSGVPRRPPIITANFSCSSDKRYIFIFIES